jgi:predicted permease
MRWYRALLFLYPGWFRDEYRDELCRAFAHRTRGRSALVVALLAIADVLPNAAAAHWDILRRGAASGLTPPAIAGDIRFALRQMARSKLFSAVVITVIALGIGVNAALMTTLDVYAWSPAPGIDARTSLVRLLPIATSKGSARMRDVRLSYAELVTLREQRGVLADVAAWEAASLPADFGAGAEPVLAFFTTGNYFRMLGAVPSAGATFADASDEVSAPVAVISHNVWTTSFGATPDIVGKAIRVMNVPFTIVGVAPPRFVGVDVKDLGREAIWIPLGARRLVESDTAQLRAIARLARGVHADDVGSRLAPVATNLSRLAPDTRTRFIVRAERLTGMPSGASDTHELIAAAFIVAALVILITCTNVSTLFLGRAVARRREMGIRLSLGATRMRLVRQALTESLVYSAAGALLGVALYAVAMKVAYATIPGIVEGIEPRLSTFGYAAGFAVATTIVFGLAPAFHATRTDIAGVVKDGGSHSVKRSRLHATFVVAQLACSVPALVVTSLVLADARAATQGMAAPASVLTMDAQLVRPSRSMLFGSGRDSAVASKLARLSSIRDQLAGTPGVQTAAISLNGGTASFSPSAAADAAVPMMQYHVSADYFSTLGIPLQRGRAIGEDEDRLGSLAVIVNRRAAELLWPGQDPIGKHLARRDPDAPGGARPIMLEVIGVAGTPPYGDEVPAPIVYAPMSTAPSAWYARVNVRVAGDARTLVPRIRAAVREAEPLVALGNLSTLAEDYADQRREAVQSNLAAFAVGLVVLVLASLGLYAIIAFAVAQRTREIGIRLAMGATPVGVARQFFVGGIAVSAIGLAIGLPITIAAIRVVKANALSFTLHNVTAVLLVIPALIGVAAAASWLPARRAARVDPLTALRAE